MSHGEHEVAADEDMQLPEIDLFGVVEVARGAQDDEEGAAVALQLGALVGLQGVLDGEGVEVEFRRQGEQFVAAGAVQADPGEGAGGGALLPERLGERVMGADPVSVAVENGVDDAAGGFGRWLGRVGLPRGLGGRGPGGTLLGGLAQAAQTARPTTGRLRAHDSTHLRHWG